MSALLVVLAACGGGATVSKPVTQPTTTTAPTTASAPTTAAQPQQGCDHPPTRVVFFEIETVDASLQVEAQELSQSMTLVDPCLDLRAASTTLADAKRRNHCGAEHPMCMAVIGAQEGADVLVFGRAERRGGSVTVVVKAIDIAKRQVLAAANKTLDASTDFGAVARETLVALLMP